MAELQALFKCLQKILSLPPPQPAVVLIVSDSLLALSAISNLNSTRPLVLHILTLLTELQANLYSVSFICASCHKGIPGNDRITAAAKLATPETKTQPASSPSKVLSHSVQSTADTILVIVLWDNETDTETKLDKLKTKK